MSTWGTRGFVPDSDDEEDLSSERQNPVRNNGDILQGEDESEANLGTGDDPQNPPKSTARKEPVPVVAKQSIEEKLGQVGGTDDNVGQQGEEDDYDELSLEYHEKAGGGVSFSPSNTIPAVAVTELQDDEFRVLSPSPGPSMNANGRKERTITELCGGKSLEPIELGDTLLQDLSTRGYAVASNARTSPAQVVSLNDCGQASPLQRNFRARKPIQMHPYQIMDGRYDADMRARGLRPVNVIHPSSVRQRQITNNSGHSGDEDSQNNTYSSPRDTPFNSPRSSHRRKPVQGSSEPIETRTPPRAQFNSSPPAQDGAVTAENELPELRDLLRPTQPRDKVYMGAKRRKLHDAEREAERLASSRRTQSQSNLGHTETTISGLISRGSLLSPHTSDRASPELPPRNAPTGFRLPPGVTPLKLSTPAASSSNNPTRHREIDLVHDHSTPAPSTSSTRPTQDTPSRYIIEVSDDSDAGELSSGNRSRVEEEETRQEAPLPYLTRGVLPKSWVKLDLQAQVKANPKNTSRPGNARHGGDGAPQAGLARRRMGPRAGTTSPSKAAPIWLDESRESSPAAPEAPRPSVPPALHQTRIDRLAEQLGFGDDDPGNMMEDNAIDFMAPAETRRQSKARAPKGPRKRRTTLHDSRDQQPKRTRLNINTGSKSKSGYVSHPTKRMKRTSHSKPPKLSILDVLPGSRGAILDLPDFLTIARRQASRQPEKGRQRPVRKVIRLQTRNDTDDACNVLQDWQSGKIRRQPDPLRTQSKGREPLVPRDLTVMQRTLPRSPQEVSEPATSSELNHSHDHHVGVGYDQENSRREPGRSHFKRWHARQKLQLQDAQLEADEDATAVLPDRIQFRLGVQQADHDFETQYSRDPALPRLLRDFEQQMTRDPYQRNPIRKSRPEHERVEPLQAPRTKQQLGKRAPRRLEVETASFRQPEEFFVSRQVRSPSVDEPQAETITLKGLNPYGMPYSREFGIVPLPGGTHFHASTFIGSGEFHQSLHVTFRNMDNSVGNHVVSLNGQKVVWGPWNEDMATNLRAVFAMLVTELAPIPGTSVMDLTNSDSVQAHLGKSVDSVREIIKANCNWLSFSDPIDRSGFVAHFLDCLDDVLSVVGACSTPTLMGPNSATATLMLRIVTLFIVLVGQLFSIASTCTLSEDFETRCIEILRKLMNHVSSYLSRRGYAEIRLFYDQNQELLFRDAGAQNDQPAVEAVVVVMQLLRNLSIPTLTFRDALSNVAHSSKDVAEVRALERKWYDLLTILPLQEIDSHGKIQLGQRFHSSFDNWEAVLPLLSRAFALYPATARRPRSTANEYLRMLLTRCHHLIQAWSWKKCESMISLVFDFFARHKYESLQHEEIRGTPPFLKNLSTGPSLEVVREDRAFQIFLKIVAVGLLGMRNRLDNRKIQGIAWRWLPNHNRKYCRDDDLSGVYLDGLRNQHDLLSTIYWASPPGFRPRLEMLQDLVDHSTSHKAPCHINIKAWSNLVAFQLSADEPTTNIEPFTAWLKDIVEQSVAQYKLARTEMEATYELGRQQGLCPKTWAEVQLMIKSNEDGIAESLMEALMGMKTAFAGARNLDAAWNLLQQSNVQAVLTLYDAKKKRGPNSVLVELVKALNELLKRIDVDHPAETLGPATRTEESQDFGDWPGEEEMPTILAVKTTLEGATAHRILDFMLEHVGHLLSNVFGSDIPPEDTLLKEIVESWAHVAVTMVRLRLKDMDDFILGYGKHSWKQLRDTGHSRKYGPYFYACLLRRDAKLATEYRNEFLAAWLESLVEREANMKYQHSLTMELLNNAGEEPLLQNPPFTHSVASGAFDISADDMRERRLAMVSNVLMNMHNYFQSAVQGHFNSLGTLRTRYASLLTHIMTKAKHNYQELQQGEEVVTGSYVTFVQRMIEFMQQYTADICPVDKFFTDSSMFPLPAHDPTYLVGRLKKLDQKLHEDSVVKILASLLQGISERAAVDHEQVYLVQQLEAAMSTSDTTNPVSLRNTLIQVIFPAYIEIALDEPSSWILAKPSLDVCRNIFRASLYGFSATNPAALQTTVTVLTTFLSSLQKSVANLEYFPEMLGKPHVLSTTAAVIDAATACIPLLDYVRRRTGLASAAADIIRYFSTYTLFIGRIVLDEPDAFPPDQLAFTAPDNRTMELTAFCRQGLQKDLREKWRMRESDYQFKVGKDMWKKVRTDVGTLEEEKEVLIGKIERFHASLSKARAF